MGFKGRSIISIRDLSKKDIVEILKSAADIESLMDSNPAKVSGIAKGKVIASLFFEPSTRTRLSFESAINRLGGKVIGFSGIEGTSITKGESLKDTAIMASKYADMIVMRHPVEGSARFVSETVDVPVINGGDGANQHPTQTLLDLYTILKRKKKLSGLTVTMIGDLKYGRTVHSLAYALSLFENMKMIFISPPELKMPAYLIDELRDRFNASITQKSNIDDEALQGDIIYATRIQKERFPDPAEYQKLKSIYVINQELLKKARKDIIVMHPLPRVDEISKEVDSMENAAYFDQAGFGLPVRMALISLIFNGDVPGRRKR